ncbi:MAG TPA: hypoxanthine phosphoribosyltransferase [Planctomycetaceae bacterium]|nr:hypoxanthine phosphoribosyltransferase [Planctomycetaceae bacterium]
MQVLLSAAEIQTGIAALAQRLDAEYRGRPLTVLGVLNGSLIFLADLIRRLDFPLRVGLVQASSYRGAATSPGALEISENGLGDLDGRDVLLLDDIFDTGRTLAGLLGRLERKRPRTLRTVVLLWKTERREVDITPDFHCFKIPNLFVVGYGLDYQDDFRHLPYVAALDDQDLR